MTENFNAGRMAFFVDFDDTLIEPQPDPTQFDLPADLRELAIRLANTPECRFTLVTGRSVAQIDAFFAPARLSVIGCHGCEARIDPEGKTLPLHEEISPSFRETILQSIKKDRNVLAENILIEDKGYAIAVHADDSILAPLARALRDIVETESPPYFLARYGHCLEIRPSSVTKGKALQHALDRDTRFAERTPVYIGDDAELDSSLSFLRARGGILLNVAAPWTTGVSFFSNPSEVRMFLNAMLNSQNNEQMALS